jgi:hypothetical protein
MSTKSHMHKTYETLRKMSFCTKGYAQGCHTRRPKANGWAGSLAHYAEREPGVLYICSKYSLKIPRIYLNMLKYTRIFFCWAGRSTGRGGRTDNPGYVEIHIQRPFLDNKIGIGGILGMKI